MAFGLDDAIAELYGMSTGGPGNFLTVNAVETAASKCGMELPQFLSAVKAARPRLQDLRLLKPGADKVLNVWKSIVNLSRSASTTAEFTEAVTAAGTAEAGAGGLLSSLLGWPGLIILALT